MLMTMKEHVWCIHDCVFSYLGARSTQCLWSEAWKHQCAAGRWWAPSGSWRSCMGSGSKRTQRRSLRFSMRNWFDLEKVILTWSSNGKAMQRSLKWVPYRKCRCRKRRERQPWWKQHWSVQLASIPQAWKKQRKVRSGSRSSLCTSWGRSCS